MPGMIAQGDDRMIAAIRRGGAPPTCSEGHWRDAARRHLQHPPVPGMDGRTRPDRMVAVLAALDADVIALQEVIGAGPSEAGTPRSSARARHGLGDGPGPAAARLPPSATSCSADFRSAPRAYDLSWKTCEPRCCSASTRSRRRHAARLQRAPRHRVSSSAVPGAAPGGHRHRPPRRRARRSCSATSTSGCGACDDAAQREAAGVDLGSTCGAGAPIRACSRSCTSITSTTQGHVEVISVELPRTRKSLMASDHLPLVAELKVRW